MTIYVSNLIECLKELSDAEFQRRVWVEGSGPEVSSLEELVSQLFDDTGLGDSIESETIAKELGDDAASALLELDSAINTLDQTLPADRLIEHPTMVRVRRLAADALSKLAIS